MNENKQCKTLENILVAAPCISSNYLIVYQLMHIHNNFFTLKH